MRYLEEMQDKYGFSDGAAIPLEAWKCREVYVAVLNKLAEKYGSEVRAVAYDRPGMHNGCMLLFAKAEDLAGEAMDWNEVATDEAMQTAVDDANEMHLDEHIIVEVRIDDGFAGFLAGL